MQTFLPYESFEETAKCLDNVRLNSQLNEAVVILRSNLGLYAPGKRTGVSGWAAHPACMMWKNHERQLVEYGLVLATEWYNRPLPASKATHAMALHSRRERLRKWQTLVYELSERNFPMDPMPLMGDEEFHSAFRSLLLWKDIQAATFRRFKQGGYPWHVVFRDIPPKKASWRDEDYEKIWEFFGQPDPPHYGQFGWTEIPAPDLVFYTTDRVPYSVRRKKVKAEKPNTPFMVSKYATAKEQSI